MCTNWNIVIYYMVGLMGIVRSLIQKSLGIDHTFFNFFYDKRAYPYRNVACVLHTYLLPSCTY